MAGKTLIAYIVLFTLVQLGGCTGDDCGDFGPYRYRLLSFDSEVVIFDFPSEQLQPWEGDPIPFESYAIHFESKTEPIALRSDPTGNALYACSPPEPYIETELTSVTITSNQDYAQGYPAGTDLSPLFEMAAYDYGFVRWTVRADEWTAFDNLIPLQFLLYPEVPPLTAGEFTFTIEFDFGDEELDNIVVTTDPVELIF